MLTQQQGMRRIVQRIVRIFGGVFLLTIVGLVGLQFAGPPGLFAPDQDAYDRTTVTVYDTSNQTLATITVRIADTPRTRYIGLSNTDVLAEDTGMLFVHDSDSEHTYSMRGMDFGLDIVFIDNEGKITTIHHAPNADGIERPATYAGSGRYVLEVRFNYTTATGIEPGHRVEIDPW